MSDKKKLEELVICNCQNTEHQMIFRTIEGETVPWVYVSIHLCPLPFRKRLWHGIKYILGYRCRYGDFDEIILTPEHYESIENVAKTLKNE
jgi:hypothetical protein